MEMQKKIEDRAIENPTLLYSMKVFIFPFIRKQLSYLLFSLYWDMLHNFIKYTEHLSDSEGKPITGEGGQKVQMSSYMFWGCNIRCGNYSSWNCIVYMKVANRINH